jgi:branched-chain amino acid transport system substrate-binding protein
MRMPRILRLTACALAALSISCGKREPEPVVIGLNFELTGDIPSIGKSAKNAAELFFEQQNAAGGIALADGPRRFKLVVSDNGANATQASAVAQRMISVDKVTALVGPNAGHCATAAGEIAEALKCVMISPWSGDAATTMDRVAGVPKRYVFRASATDEIQGRAMANFALSKLGARKAAILSDAAGGPAAQAAAFKETFTAGGGEIAAEQTFDAEERDFTQPVAAVAAAAPEVVFIAAPCDQALPILEAAKSAGLNAKFLGTELWNSPQTIRMTALGFEELYFCKNYDHRDTDPASEKFAKAYAAKYGQPPDDVAALTYDACGLIAEALKKSGKNEREALREQFAQLRGYAGAAGTYNFRPGSGDPEKSMPVLQIKSSGLEWVGDSAP